MLTSKLPELPDLADKPALTRECGNPTGDKDKDKLNPESWKTYWVIKGHILAGGYPGNCQGTVGVAADMEMEDKLLRILNAGVAPSTCIPDTAGKDMITETGPTGTCEESDFVWAS
jgi:hypothetical protein